MYQLQKHLGCPEPQSKTLKSSFGAEEFQFYKHAQSFQHTDQLGTLRAHKNDQHPENRFSSISTNKLKKERHRSKSTLGTQQVTAARYKTQ